MSTSNHKEHRENNHREHKEDNLFVNFAYNFATFAVKTLKNNVNI